jgi:hypothetical protein
MAVTKTAILGAVLLASGVPSASGAPTTNASARPERPAHRRVNAGPPDPYTLDGLVTDAMDYPWTAKERLPLFAGPGSRKRVGALAPGEVVIANHLQLRGRPWEVRVIYDREPFRVGMRMWILEREMEEGSFELWYRGEKRQDLSAAIDFGPSDEPCGPPSKQCFLHFSKEPKQESWYRVVSQRGLTGWTAREDGFAIGKIKNEAPPVPK